MLDNKYYRWYRNIVYKAQSELRVWKRGIYERHHILPRSLGGTNDNSNLVLLTFREHYVCHHLLTKFTIDKDRTKMIFAFWAMTNKWGRSRFTDTINSYAYAHLKTEVSALISKLNSGKSYPLTEDAKKLISHSKLGSKNPMYGKAAPNRGKKRPGVGGRKKGTKWSAAERVTQQALRSSPDFYNYLYDPIRCQKISNSLRGRQGSAEGKKWFNNGVKETYDTICPEGYSLGRLSRTQPNKQGMKWYNNGKVNRQFKDNFVEQGFMRGRISKK